MGQYAKNDSQKCTSGMPDIFFSVEKLQQYIHFGTLKSYVKGSAVLLPGDASSALIYVVSGKLRVNKLFPDGRERMIYITGKHGLVGKLFETCNDTYVIAVEDSTACFFAKEQLKKIFQLDEDIVFDIIRNYLSKVSYYIKQTAEMDYFNPTVRVVRLLYELCITNGIKVDNSYEINIQLSLENISEITGTHYVTVSKVLGCLRRQHILEKKRKKIIVHDLDKLKILTEEKHVF